MPIFQHSFAASALYRERPESLKGFLAKRWSFWLALFSCVAFLIGNMVGQHGWVAFWKSVWGKEEIAIVFTGTVSPVPFIPDTDHWNPMLNHTETFSEVPDDILVPFPAYQPLQGCGANDHDRRLLSVDYDGDYASGGLGCGSHPAADILVPKGTPVVAVMNGIVDRVEKRSWGFGNTIVLKHPNVPDPDHSGRKITLYSGYAHLSEVLVTVGEILQKGERIATSGQTGLATAPHLHFQLDREAAPFHPYWPFTTEEAAAAGYGFNEAVDAGLGQTDAMRYTVNPLAYVEMFKNGTRTTLLADAGTRNIAQLSSSHSSSSVSSLSSVGLPKEEAPAGAKEEVSSLPSSKPSIKERLLTRIRAYYSARRKVRTAERIARRDADSSSSLVLNATSANVAAVAIEGPVTRLEESLMSLVTVSPSTAEQNIPMPQGGDVASITMLHDGKFHQDWEEIVLFARDAEGRFVRNVHFEGSIYIETTFGGAEFSPSALTAEQFDSSGRAVVRMLPKLDGRRSIVPAIRGAFTIRGEPFLFDPSEDVRDANIASDTVSIQ